MANEGGQGPVLEIQRATRAMQGHNAPRVVLDDVSLSLWPNEVVALIGPNGAGKTSLIRAVCGRLALDSGRITLVGKDPGTCRHARRSLGIVPQAIALYPHLTARENLEVFARLAGVPKAKIDAAVEHALQAVDLASRGDSVAATLSGGMQRRLNIVAAILHKPRVLLLDEPTVGVDPSARERTHKLLRELKGKGMSLLLTTHDLNEAESLGDRVVILLNGRIAAQGTPKQLVSQVFDGAKELSVVLASDPGPQARALLEAQGMFAVRGERRWMGRLQSSLDKLSDFGARLRHAGVVVTELTVREPGLRGVFFRYTGEHLES